MLGWVEEVYYGKYWGNCERRKLMGVLYVCSEIKKESLEVDRCRGKI